MSTVSNLNIGMVGCGVHASANIYPSILVAGGRIRSIAARHLAHADAAAAKFSAERTYDSYAKMLEKEQNDVIFVITEGEQHFKIVSDCLLAGKHVFVEKPLGLNEQEAQAIAELAERVNRKVMVGFMKRFAPSYTVLKEFTRDALRFGRPVSFQGMFGITAGRSGWVDEKYLRFGAIHFVDLMRFYFGEAAEVVGFANSHDVNVAQSFCLRFESGVVGSMFFAGLKAWKRHYEEITITGENGFGKAVNLGSVVLHSDRGSTASVPRWQTVDEEDQVVTSVSTSSSGGLKDLYQGGYVGEVQHFLDCIVKDMQNINSAPENVKTTRLCDQILHGLKR
jgi:predicted dehydrogenase